MSAVICPTSRSYRAEAVLGSAGGALEVAGHRLFVPAGVLTAPTRLVLEAPAGREVKLQLSAGGTEHYQFNAPVVVTISYRRCGRQHRPPSVASAWYVDDTGTRLLEPMGGRDDRNRRSVTFRTTHFSTYLVAY
jgi:hypothetical protein